MKTERPPVPAPMSVCAFGLDQGRVPVILHEGERSLLKEVRKEVRVWLAGEELVQESQTGDLRIFQDAEPEPLVLLQDTEPAIEDAGIDAKVLTESFHRKAGLSAGKVRLQYLQNEEESIGGVRDGEIGDNGMRTSAAVTPNTQDMQGVLIYFSVTVIHDVAVIVRVGVTVAGGTAGRTAFQFGTKSAHEVIEEGGG